MNLPGTASPRWGDELHLACRMALVAANAEVGLTFGLRHDQMSEETKTAMADAEEIAVSQLASVIRASVREGLSRHRLQSALGEDQSSPA